MDYQTRLKETAERLAARNYEQTGFWWSEIKTDSVKDAWINRYLFDAAETLKMMAEEVEKSLAVTTDPKEDDWLQTYLIEQGLTPKP